MVGKPEVRERRRRALREHLQLASEFPGEKKYRRAVSRDCLEVARSIGISNPVEAVEKERLFRQAVAIRQDLEDRSFETKAELAEALAFLGHLLNATDRAGEGGQVMARGRALVATLASQSAADPTRRHRVVALEDLFALPRYCDPSPNPDEALRAYTTVRDGKARLVAEFPFIPEFRAELAWSQFVLASRFRTFGRVAEAEAGLRQSLGIFEELLKDHPTVDHYRRWAATAFENLGRLLAQSNRHREAREHFRRAVELVPEGQNLRARVARELAAARRRGRRQALGRKCRDRHSSRERSMTGPPQRPGHFRPVCRRAGAVSNAGPDCPVGEISRV